MILIDSPQKITVPNHLSYEGDKFLRLINNFTSETTSITLSSESNNFYHFDIPVLPEGQYTYLVCLSEDNLPVEAGLLYYGEINTTKQEHKNENNTYVYERK